jgi:hypothetical protein
MKFEAGSAVAPMPSAVPTGVTRPRILIIEDERALTKVLSYNLVREG